MKPTKLFNIYTAVISGVALSVLSAYFIVEAQTSISSLTNDTFTSRGPAYINVDNDGTNDPIGLYVYQDATFYEDITASNGVTIGNTGIGDFIIKRNGLCSTDGTQTNCRSLVNYGDHSLHLNFNGDFDHVTMGGNGDSGLYIQSADDQGIHFANNNILEWDGGSVIKGYDSASFLILQSGQLNFYANEESSNAMTFGVDKVLSVPVEIETTKLETTSIVHLEQGVTVQYLYGSCNCEQCGVVLPYGPQNLQRLVRWFIGEPACAAEACYRTCNPTDAPACSTLGGGWIELYTWIGSCNNRKDCDGASCSNPATYSNYGTYYSRKCQGPAGALNEAVKIEFDYDTDIGLNTTYINDNLNAENNTLESCLWALAGVTQCPNGMIMAGWNGVNLWCCEL